MGKLTKAERDTLVKRIQDKKSSVVICCIGAIVQTVLLVLSLGSVPLMILFGILAAGMIIAAVGCNSAAERMQDELDKDSE